MAVDPIALAQDLIRCPSVTPADAGAIGVLADALEGLGFTCHRLSSDERGGPAIANLYARLGDGAPNFAFAGHTDVVPVGDAAAWGGDPFAGTVENGRLHGRGAADMKGALAAMVAAASTFVGNGKPAGSISFLVTGDEEGRALNGTRSLLDWMNARGETVDACLLGEPTNPDTLGTTIKVGRRGSMTGRLTVHGTQGHVAYPHLADNPLPRLVRLLQALTDLKLDPGTAHFDPSNLEVVSIDVGNTASNVIPAKGGAVFNIRFNDSYGSASLEALIRKALDDAGGGYELEFEITGESFLTPPGELAAIVRDAVQAATGLIPDYSTTGGTSDARFIHHHCPVVEFGLVGQTMHKVDENVAVADVLALTAIYQGVLERYFSRPLP
ncbi:MAG TPA: succinyl-diaminopimelate desuccinylase [Alphaproteobacteria bacterium]|jgi:succinyl-diaminopimelate desuccinylase|nr:succinyl-diaminopimelate desuccinylase [Alphaproteobacteria bacterium]